MYAMHTSCPDHCLATTIKSERPFMRAVKCLQFKSDNRLCLEGPFPILAQVENNLHMHVTQLLAVDDFRISVKLYLLRPNTSVCS